MKKWTVSPTAVNQSSPLYHSTLRDRPTGMGRGVQIRRGISPSTIKKNERVMRAASHVASLAAVPYLNTFDRSDIDASGRGLAP
jgi:hypothetical protein